MNQQDSMNKIIDILKKSALKFRDDFDTNLECYFIEEKKDDEILIHFNIKYDREFKYLIIFKKQKTMANYIPNLKGYNKLDLNLNPYKNMNFTEENAILSNIYDNIKEMYVEEIACYKKFGIILRNPLELKGIYNINIIYLTD